MRVLRIETKRTVNAGGGKNRGTEGKFIRKKSRDEESGVWPP